MTRTQPGLSKADSKAQLALIVRELLHAQPAMTLNEVSRKLSVPERTLRRLFREAFGTSPGQYQLALRLTSVRDQLLSVPGNQKTICEIAARHGFEHQGRFSAQYRRLFGETPSQTRAKGLPTSSSK